MKKIVAITLLFLCIISCGKKEDISISTLIEEGNIQTLRSERSNLITKQQALSEQIQQLDKAIATLDPIKKIPIVTAITAKDTLFKHYLELQGNVKTKQNIVIYPETGGILTKVYVKKGQHVAKGQALASIDDGGMGQQLAQAEVQVQLAKTTFDRQKRLWDQKIGSEIQYLQAKATYESQQNMVNQIKQQLAKATVNAPFSGVIDDVIVEQGSVVSPGQTPLIRIVNLKQMYIETEVPESHLPNITKGKEVTVYFPILDKTIETTVKQVGNYINPNNRSFLVEIAIPNTDGMIKPNLTAKVKINDYTKEKALLIPQSIISENANGNQYVYVATKASNDHIAEAQRVIITTGLTQGDHTEILEGLKSGDAIISEGARSIREGQKVKIVN